MSKERVYVLAPVRKVTEDQADQIAKHVESLHKQGARVFNPIDDAPQDDATGYNIVMTELNFLHKAAEEGGRVDILWNLGGEPSEGSRVDIGMAVALGLDLNLVGVFNEESPTGPQLAYRIIRSVDREMPQLQKIIQKIKKDRRAVVDWDIDMLWEDQEWQRIYLGLTLGCWAQNPNIRIKLGKLMGIDPADKKSYPKVIREMERVRVFVPKPRGESY
ncbi:MAG: hypothetical protein UV71_C0001G0133 [Microgenomates group bacterium GW2011_GWC1_43_13]|uniref:Nucleoside 2-deoxyribosyltransferase n=3 Tax=Candidatus Woeseibacteriota TaxID=1752722 RepID=A0A837IG13_9BACT|nr:MAG: hypothetical protein UV71_C0001G0133 [Microgenomates group bacterium GW2011_GWC1_43_13]KKT32456.1 MAG: hypothetical protein UW20_C0014G0006 [Candidatus Woesebacteria bacterium GW2011_GWB1_44_11]KKT54894.1 MAG: hypothetical protein UW47_C0002G0078 [Candidatus Woesebacteria bacterium GW2011_GWA1_44_23]OGM76065.1 MAG: hypothetical protein A2208_02575 [Candidatus Woesebacteria bacterium RIFOXYA1_FULL_43_16]OGM88420.1 MAG: hypothetical protein A2573_02455 [Candidatus Woesebacteria bacterium 